MRSIRSIVTHPGQAHRDEFIACCLVMAACNKEIRIERREPNILDLEDPEVFVIDIGGFYQPEMGNFDHHQRGREEEPICSITLLMKEIGMNLEIAREVFPWLEFSEVLDVKGPISTAKEFDIPRESFFNTLSPIESQILHLFSQRKFIWPSYCSDLEGPTDLRFRSSVSSTMMLEIGKGLLDYYNEVQERLELLEETTRFTNIDGMEVVEVNIPGDKKPSLGVEIYLKEVAPNVQVVISEDDRGDGMSLFRRVPAVNHADIDFSRVEGREDILFAHKGGFICKTKSRKDPVFEIITEALR